MLLGQSSYLNQNRQNNSLGMTFFSYTSVGSLRKFFAGTMSVKSEEQVSEISNRRDRQEAVNITQCRG